MVLLTFVVKLNIVTGNVLMNFECIMYCMMTCTEIYFRLANFEKFVTYTNKLKNF